MDFFPAGCTSSRTRTPPRAPTAGWFCTTSLCPPDAFSCLHVCAMDLEDCPVKIHERARPRVERPHAPLQLVHVGGEIQPAVVFFEHGCVGHAFFGLRLRTSLPVR